MHCQPPRFAAGFPAHPIGFCCKALVLRSTAPPQPQSSPCRVLHHHPSQAPRCGGDLWHAHWCLTTIGVTQDGWCPRGNPTLHHFAERLRIGGKGPSCSIPAPIVPPSPHHWRIPSFASLAVQLRAHPFQLHPPLFPKRSGCTQWGGRAVVRLGYVLAA